MTARHEISRLAPSRADPFQSTAGWVAMPKGSRISGAGRRWSAVPSPSRKLDCGFADEPFPARAKARRRKSSLGQCGAESGGEIFLPANP
jgi:hypothetical protein